MEYHNQGGVGRSTMAPGSATPPPSFSDLGIPASQGLRRTCCGLIKPSLSRTEKLFLLVSSISLLVSLGFTIDRLASLKRGSDDYTFAMMLCFTSCFCFFYIIHGVLKERYYEIAVFIASSVVLLVYLLLNLISTNEKNPNLNMDSSLKIKLARFIAAVVFEIFICVLGGMVIKNYSVQARMLFDINARSDYQSMYKRLFLCSSLISFDLQIQGSMLIFVLENGTNLSSVESLVLIIGAVVTIAWATAGYLAMHYENKAWLVVFAILWFPNCIYIGYRLHELSTEEMQPGTVLYKATIFCAVLALLSRLALAVAMFLVQRNFGKGLAEKLAAIGTEPGNNVQEDDSPTLSGGREP